MKVICALRSPSAPESPASVPIEITPDSAIVKDGRPVFLPQIEGGWEFWIGVALRSSRLGKNVGARFAMRYVDAATLCLMPRPKEGYAPADDLSHSFDGAAAIGRWLPLDALAGEFSCRAMDRDVEVIATAEGQLGPMLERVTRYTTLKMGDLLLPARTRLDVDLRPGSVFTATLCGQPCLNFKLP